MTLKDNVVVIDEAHNLLDALNDMHSVTLTVSAPSSGATHATPHHLTPHTSPYIQARHLSEVSAQLAQYAERYNSRFKPANRIAVQQLLNVVRALRRSLLPRTAPPPPAGAAAAGGVGGGGGGGVGGGGGAADEQMLKLNAYLCSLNIDNINLFDLRAFCHASEIAKKLRGYADAQHAVRRHGCGGSGVGSGGSDGGGGGASTLHPVIQLLDALTNSDADARVLLHIPPPSPPPAAAASASAAAASSSSSSAAAASATAAAAVKS